MRGGLTPRGSLGVASSARRALILWACLELALAALLGQLAAQTVYSYCDEDFGPPSSLSRGCDFLEGGGYTAVRIIPVLLVITGVILAVRARRVRVVHLGLGVALLFVITAIAVEPGEYPWT